MTAIVHADKYDTMEAWCGTDEDGWENNCVYGSEWRESPTALSRVTCPHCLTAIFTLGQWAANAMSRLPAPVPRGATWNPPPPRKP